MLKHGSGCSPVCITIAIRVLGNIDCVVHECHRLVRGLMFELIPILSTKIKHLVDDVLVCFWDLDGVRLDVGYIITLLLDIEHQIHHEERSTLSNDVIHIANIAELVVELSTSQAVDRVNDDLQRLLQVLLIFIGSPFQIWLELSIQELACSIHVVMLDRNTSALNIGEPLGVVSEEIQFLDGGWVHGRHIQ